MFYPKRSISLENETIKKPSTKNAPDFFKHLAKQEPPLSLNLSQQLTETKLRLSYIFKLYADRDELFQ